MRDWNVRKLLALFLLMGLAVFSLRVLLGLLILGGLLTFAALVVGVVVFTRWRSHPAANTARSPETGARFAPGLRERLGRPDRLRNLREENVS